MMKNEYATTVLNDESSMLSFFDAQKASDVWAKIYTNEIDALPLEEVDASFYINGAVSMKGRNANYSATDIAKETTAEDIESSSTTSGLFAAIPLNDRYTVYPLRYTAFPHLLKRAGLGGPSLSDLSTRNRHERIESEKRADIINMCLPLYRDKTLVLIRDGKITAFLSGDEADYAVLPMADLIKALKEELDSSYSTSQFVSCETNYDITRVVMSIQDQVLENNIKTLLSSFKKGSGQPISVRIALTSSDVGKSEARLQPILNIGKVSMVFGNSVSVKHNNHATVEKFKEEASKMLLGFRDNIKDIEKLNSINVNYPSSCIKNIMDSINLVGYSKYMGNLLDRIETEHSDSCTAFDIYFYLNELLINKFEADKNAGTESLFGFMKDQDKVVSVLKLRFEDYDY